MKNLRVILKFVIISICIAIIICLVQLNSYFMKMLRLDSSAQEYATYSIQHESNPLDKDIRCFMELYNKLLPDQNEEYKYYELYMQYLENDIENIELYSVKTNELTKPCLAVKAIQISENVIQDFCITVSEGRLYDQGDFMHEQNEAIPVLMGNAYTSLYNVGDTFDFEYLYDDYTFEVIGFLEKGDHVTLGGKSAVLDTYIVMPSFSIGDNVQITNGLKIHYANKTSGIVKMDMDQANLFYTDIEPLLSSADVGKYSWIIRPLELQFKDILGMSIFVFMGLIYSVCLTLAIIVGGVIIRLRKAEKGPDKRVNRVINTLIIFCLSSVVYLFIHFIYTLVLGIVIMKNICFLIIGLVSIFISACVHSQTQNRKEQNQGVAS